MIHARFWIEGKTFCMSVDGHADSAPYGKDIVCAGASITAQGLLNEILMDNEEHKLAADPVTELVAGQILVKALPRLEYRKEIRAKFLFAQHQFELLAGEESYQDYVSLVRFPKNIR